MHKTVFSGHNLEMHIKAHAGKRLTNADIEEKSPSEQRVHTGKWKQHQDTLEKLFYWFTSVHHLESFQLKLEPQLTQVGANSLFLPMVVTICLRRFEAGVNTFPHISEKRQSLFDRHQQRQGKCIRKEEWI